MTTATYDGREEIWNALTHGFGFLLSLIGGAVLITLAALRGDAWQLSGAIVFSVSLSLLYCASTLYHAIPHVIAKARLKIFDHCAIFVLIAGTYTPFALTGLRMHGGWWLFAAAWTMAVAGVVFKLFHTGRLKRLSTLIYLGMGWMAVAVVKPFLEQVPTSALWWLLAGGLAYSVGTVFYLSKRRFAHARWHVLVLIGSGCHFAAVANQVVPAR